MELGLIILSGGKSSRMGCNKVWLNWQGQTFIEKMIHKAKDYGFTDIIVVANDAAEEYKTLPIKLTKDVYTDCGPLGGIHAGLSFGSLPYYVVVSCDMPLLDFHFVEGLTAYLDGINQAIVPLTKEHQQPLAAIYHRDCIPVIVQLLERGERKIDLLLQDVETKRVPLYDFSRSFFNVNTPEELVIAKAKAINGKRRIPIVSIVASTSGSGKTTFITKLLPLLKQMGLRTAVLKSDGHGFDLDHEGKDTWQFSQAGADVVAIVSPQQYAIIAKTQEKKSLLEVAAKIDAVDLILIESRQHGVFPILEIFRGDIHTELITPREDLAGILTDQFSADTNIKLLPLDEPEKTALFIQTLL